MLWLNNLREKLIGSNLAVTQPNFEQAPKLKLDFSGNTFRLRHAIHTAMFPLHESPGDLDIYNTANFKPQSDGSFAQRVYVRGWILKGRSDRSIGGIKVSAILLNFCNRTSSQYNCFDDSNFTQEALQYCHDIYSIQNEGASLGNLGDGRYRYPVKANEFRYQTINSINWCCFKAGKKGHPSELGFMTPISSRHIMAINFDIEAFGKVDYFSPETNIQQACESVVKEFMENVFIELSPKSLKEKEQTKLLAAIV